MRARKSGRKAGKKKQKNPVVVPKRRRNTIKNALTTLERKRKTPLGETLMAFSDEENVYERQ
jgi:hypothetical protein